MALNLPRHQFFRATFVTILAVGICSDARADDALASWNNGRAKTAILDFVAAVTDENDTDYVLAKHDCLHYSLLSARVEWGFLQRDEARDIEINGSLSTNNGEVLMEAAIQGVGITMLPAVIVNDALEDGRLKAILTRYEPRPFGLYAVRPSRQFTPARVRLFIEYIAETIQGDSPPASI